MALAGSCTVSSPAACWADEGAPGFAIRDLPHRERQRRTHDRTAATELSQLDMPDNLSNTDEILRQRHGALAVVTLNRPKALNTLTLGMYRTLDPELVAWGMDPAIRAVLIRGAGDRAFCAGGDVRAIYEAGRGQTAGLTADFFREEYHLIQRVYRFPKPYIALLGGITMRGGAR